MFLAEIIKAEIIKQTKDLYEPTEDVINECKAYLEECGAEKADEIPDLISDYIADNLIQCEICERYIPVGMEERRTFGLREYVLCPDVECHKEAHAQAHFSPRREWGTY